MGRWLKPDVRTRRSHSHAAFLSVSTSSRAVNRPRSHLHAVCVYASGVPADRGHVVRDGDVRVPADPERADEPGRAGE